MYHFGGRRRGGDRRFTGSSTQFVGGFTRGIRHKLHVTIHTHEKRRHKDIIPSDQKLWFFRLAAFQWNLELIHFTRQGPNKYGFFDRAVCENIKNLRMVFFFISTKMCCFWSSWRFLLYEEWRWRMCACVGAYIDWGVGGNINVPLSLSIYVNSTVNTVKSARTRNLADLHYRHGLGGKIVLDTYNPHKFKIFNKLILH